MKCCRLSMGLPAWCFYFILFFGCRGKLLYGGVENACHFGRGVYVWDRVGCQFLSGAEVCVAVSLWQGDWGGRVGARQGLTWSKTQMQSHIGKVREGENSHAGLPTHPLSHCPPPPPHFPIITPMEAMNHNWTVASPTLHLCFKQLSIYSNKNDKNKHWILTVHGTIRGLSM